MEEETHTVRVIILPSGRQVRLGEYVRSWQALLAMSPETRVDRWNDWSASARDILRDLRDGIHDRINRHIEWYGRGRRWAPNWQRQTRHLANAINTPRLIIDWIPIDYRSRFQHRLRCPATQE